MSCVASFFPVQTREQAHWSFYVLRNCAFKIFRKCGFQDGLVCLVGFCGVYSQAAVGRAIKGTGYTPICSKVWRSSGQTMSGAPTSATSLCGEQGERPPITNAWIAGPCGRRVYTEMRSTAA